MSTPSLRLSSTSSPDPRGYRFGPFELEIRSGELRKHGVRLRVRKQSVQILVMLLSHPGEVVLREEIRRKLWPDNTTVEFDHSINTAIQRLRDVLGDSPEESRYVETLAGRGYRFIESVEVLERRPVPATMAMHGSDPGTGIRQVEHRPRSLPVLQIAVVATLCVVAAAGWLRPVSHKPLRNWVFPLGVIGDAVPSPDGSAILYRKPEGLFLRRLDSNAETELYSATRLIDFPAWSPDGSQALFQTAAGLMRSPVPHGPPVTIWPDRHLTRGYSWGSEGAILLAALEANGPGSLYLIEPGSASPQRLEIPQLKAGRFYEPEFLPQGGKFLFSWAAPGDGEAGIYLATLKHGKVVDAPLLLRRNTTAGHFASAGGDKLLYVHENNLYAQPLDLRSGALQGVPRRILENVFSILEMRHAFFTVSRNGVLAWRPGKAGLTRLTWFDRSGKVLGTAGPPCEPSAIVLSPDDNHLLLTIGDHFGAILDPHQSSYTRLPGVVRGLWTPDNAHLLYRPPGWNRVLERDLARGSDREVAQVPGLKELRALSPDGKVLLYSADGGIYSVRLDGSPGQVQPMVTLPEDCTHVGFSPDSRLLVYSNYVPSVKRWEVFVKPIAFAGLGKQISMDGGTAPVWRGDGREILYSNRSTIYGVRVNVNPKDISVSRPEPLFDVRVPAGLVGDSVPFAVVHDGSRILFAQAAEGADSKMTHVMTAWDRGFGAP